MKQFLGMVILQILKLKPKKLLLMDFSEINIFNLIQTIEELKKVADISSSMPPKSTWIEPKLRSGLIVYEY